MRRTIAVLVVALPLAAACGSRGPLDITGPYAYADSGADGTVTTDAGTTDGGADGPSDSGQPIINCALCVGQQCNMQLLQCIQSTPCRTIMQCAVQKCLGMGGGFNVACLAQCGTDFQALAQVLAVVTCVTGKCGEQCLGLLGMMGGGKDWSPGPDN
jgi:predicted small lipoprotein YifL